jgi:hypothetical protein
MLDAIAHWSEKSTANTVLLVGAWFGLVFVAMDAGGVIGGLIASFNVVAVLIIAMGSIVLGVGIFVAIVGGIMKLVEGDKSHQTRVFVRDAL